MFQSFMGGLGALPLARHGKSRSINCENPHGEKGKGGMAVEGSAKDAARDLGRGWKVNPFLVVQPG